MGDAKHSARLRLVIGGVCAVALVGGVIFFGMSRRSAFLNGNTERVSTPLTEAQQALETKQQLLFYGVAAESVIERQELPATLAFLIPPDSQNIIVEKVARLEGQQGYVAAYRKELALKDAYEEALGTFDTYPAWEMLGSEKERLAAFIEARSEGYEVRVSFTADDGQEGNMHMATVMVNVR